MGENLFLFVVRHMSECSSTFVSTNAIFFPPFTKKKTAELICRDLRFRMLSASVSAVSSSQPSLEQPAQWTVNIIGILTPSGCGEVCKIVNKGHDGPAACCPGDGKAYSHWQLSK